MLLMPKLGLCKIAQLGRILACRRLLASKFTTLGTSAARHPPLDAVLASQTKTPEGLGANRGLTQALRARGGGEGAGENACAPTALRPALSQCIK